MRRPHPSHTHARAHAQTDAHAFSWYRERLKNSDIFEPRVDEEMDSVMTLHTATVQMG